MAEVLFARHGKIGAFLAGLSLLFALCSFTYRNQSNAFYLTEIDDSFLKVNDDAECGYGWNASEYAAFENGLIASWSPPESQRSMCDSDLVHRIETFVPWSYNVTNAEAQGYNGEFQGEGINGDGGAVFESSIATSHPISSQYLESYRERLGKFLAAFGRMDTEGSGIDDDDDDRDDLNDQGDSPFIMRKQVLNKIEYLRKSDIPDSRGRDS